MRLAYSPIANASQARATIADGIGDIANATEVVERILKPSVSDVDMVSCARGFLGLHGRSLDGAYAKLRAAWDWTSAVDDASAATVALRTALRQIERFTNMGTRFSSYDTVGTTREMLESMHSWGTQAHRQARIAFAALGR